MSVHPLPKRDTDEDFIAAVEGFAPAIGAVVDALLPLSEKLRGAELSPRPSVKEFCIATYRLIAELDEALARIDDHASGQLIDLNERRNT